MIPHLQEACARGGGWLFTLLEGESAGEKLLCSGGEPVWTSRKAGLLREHREALMAMPTAGILTVEGLRVFAERLGGAPRLIVCGAGTVGRALIPMAAQAGFAVTALEDRPEFAESAKALGAQAVLCAPFAEALAQVEESPENYFVVVTREHRYDTACLRAILQKPHAYLGMMGSRRRSALIRERLLAEGFAPAQVGELQAPIGLEIGAETPAEIAVSILAQLIQCKNREKKTEGFSAALLNAMLRETQPFVLAQIVERQGSTPRGVGAKMLVHADGSVVESIGGGWMEAEVIDRAKVMLLQGETTLLTEAALEGSEGAPMLCGGRQLIFLERIVP